MQNELLKSQDEIIRVLKECNSNVFIINCTAQKMPYWISMEKLSHYEKCDEKTLLNVNKVHVYSITEADENSRRIAHERYGLIAPILTFMDDKNKRNELIDTISKSKSISKQTIRKYFCMYLVYQNICVLAPKKHTKDTCLTKDEKNIRWALNKYYYTRDRHSLNNTYLFMLKEKYCTVEGMLLPDYPSFYQFRYFYRKHKNTQNYHISRNGLANYQRNKRPLLGNKVQEFAPAAGTGMLDSTICDIFLIDETNTLVGRPILTVCIDAYSSLCCGYTLTWEGGIYSLRSLMYNIVSNKKKHCKKFGISIDNSQWNSMDLPGNIVTDMGVEYTSNNFEQITELGVTLINLPPFRPELKGPVEKFFDIIQNMYKPYLKNKGIVEPDYMKRGAHDYKKDACLTINEFEKIILNCIIYYNSQRIIKNFPYTDDMINKKVKPYANEIWEYGKTIPGANLISVSQQKIILTLLPRAEGEFTRYGLKVNNLRYRNKNYMEKYLSGGKVPVAYDPDNSSNVWVIENGKYVKFNIIESQYSDQKLTDINSMKKTKKDFINSFSDENKQSQINLANAIEAIVNNTKSNKKPNNQNITEAKRRARRVRHKDYIMEG